MENVLLDKHLTHFNQEKWLEYIKNYTGTIYEVGKDIKGTSFDENCANFCIEHNCDFLTTDKTAYHHFFKIKRVKSVEIFQFLKNEPTASKNNPRPVYRLSFKTEESHSNKNQELSKGVKLS